MGKKDDGLRQALLRTIDQWMKEISKEQLSDDDDVAAKMHAEDEEDITK